MRIQKLTPEQEGNEDYFNNIRGGYIIFSPGESGCMEELDRLLAFHGLELVLHGTGSSYQPASIGARF